jgi:hypothetical protein
MNKSDTEEHVLEVYSRAYAKIRYHTTLPTFTSGANDIAQGQARLAEAAVKLTKIIIEAERDQR